MKDNQKLEYDILSFFKEIENQSESDKIVTLRMLLDKYIHITKSDYIMDKSDFNEIISNAKKLMVERQLPVRIGKIESAISESEIANLCVIESTIMSLNKRGCLKKIAKFDYKE